VRPRALSMARPSKKLLSRRFLQEFGVLQQAVRDLGQQRGALLRIFVLSRSATTASAQREHWLEFVWVDQEYRVAVQRLARFCERHQVEQRDAGEQLLPATRGTPRPLNDLR